MIYENEWSQSSSGQRRSVSFLLQSMYYESDSRQSSFGLLYRILMGYESDNSSSQSDWNFNLLSFVLASDSDSFHNSFLPIYWYEKNPYSTSSHFIPLLTFNHWDSDGYTGLHGPVYVEKDNHGYRRYFAISPLVFESEWQSEASGQDFGETSFLLNSMYYENRRDYSQAGLLWRGLGGYRNDRNSDYWNANFVTFVMANSSDGWHHSFLPLYYMDQEKESLDVWIPPLLGWSHSTPAKVSEGLGLGLLWYRSRDDAMQEHFRSVLMGGLLYYDRYKGAQNGFRKWGSLYGFLWDYEVEPSSGYEKFSILKFIFSRT